jgi:riboflavin synthase
VDGTATLLSLTPITPNQPETDWRLRIQLPETLTRYVVPQGSITIEGISLTVASIVDDVVEVAIIPHTYAATSLHTLTPGTLLNIEVDVLSKYAERRRSSEKFTLTEQYLIANGY